jgi:hypothetical protein
VKLKIKELMAQPAEMHDLAWLQTALQAAIELELSTLPPYLCGLYALTDQKSDAAKLIGSIVLDEMSHLGLACNLLTAAGVQPKIFDGYDWIVYPGPLPGGVRPKCDPSLRFPCDPNFEVELGFPDYQSFVRMCMQIEYPEDPVPRPALLALTEETYPTIGQFYDAVLNAFKYPGNKVPYETGKQLENAFPSIIKIDGLPAATTAITTIQKQGEGGPRYPFVDRPPAPPVLSHFYKFGEIYFGKAYVFDPVKQTGDWTGSPVSVPPAFPMTPVPKGGYATGAPSQVADCDAIFTTMLRQLDTAWANGDLTALNDAVDSMEDLKTAVTGLLKKQIARPDGGIYGPQFRKTTK